MLVETGRESRGSGRKGWLEEGLDFGVGVEDAGAALCGNSDVGAPDAGELLLVLNEALTWLAHSEAKASVERLAFARKSRSLC